MIKDAMIAAMLAGDLLAEAELRYKVIAAVLEPSRRPDENARRLNGREVKALSLEADRLMQKIAFLRAERVAKRSSKGRAPTPSSGFDGWNY